MKVALLYTPRKLSWDCGGYLEPLSSRLSLRIDGILVMGDGYAGIK
jgi:hypothetical protein